MFKFVNNPMVENTLNFPNRTVDVFLHVFVVVKEMMIIFEIEVKTKNEHNEVPNCVSCIIFLLFLKKMDNINKHHNKK